MNYGSSCVASIRPRPRPRLSSKAVSNDRARDRHTVTSSDRRSGAPPSPRPAGCAADGRAPHQGLSLGDIARQLKLSVRQVEALERDDHGGFPGVVFVRGFLRNYAKLLRLDPDSLVAQAIDRAGAGRAAVPEMPMRPCRQSRGRHRSLIGFGVLARGCWCCSLVRLPRCTRAQSGSRWRWRRSAPRTSAHAPLARSTPSRRRRLRRTRAAAPAIRRCRHAAGPTRMQRPTGADSCGRHHDAGSRPGRPRPRFRRAESDRFRGRVLGGGQGWQRRYHLFPAQLGWHRASHGEPPFVGDRQRPRVRLMYRGKPSISVHTHASTWRASSGIDWRCPASGPASSHPAVVIGDVVVGGPRRSWSSP